MKAIGILLVAIGLVGLIWGGINWTERESVVDLGPVEITTEDRESLPIPPIVGAVCLIAGAIVLAGSRGR
jgi:hypothetical protein